MNRHAVTRAAFAALPIFALSLTAEAATVGFWQFNAGAFLEDSAGTSDLALEGDVTQVNLPAAGRGAAFPGTSPAAEFAGGSGNRLVTTITPIGGDFTIEAYIHSDARVEPQIIAGSETSSNPTSARAWSFFISFIGDGGGGVF